jgi:hypothetical protein
VTQVTPEAPEILFAKAFACLPTEVSDENVIHPINSS